MTFFGDRNPRRRTLLKLKGCIVELLINPGDEYENRKAVVQIDDVGSDKLFFYSGYSPKEGTEDHKRGWVFLEHIEEIRVQLWRGEGEV